MLDPLTLNPLTQAPTYKENNRMNTPATTDAPESRPSGIFHQSSEEYRWTPPALRPDAGPEAVTGTQHLIDQITRRVPELPGLELLWKLRTGALEAWSALARLEQEAREQLRLRNERCATESQAVQSELARVQSRQEAVRRELIEPELEFAQKAAEADLTCTPDDAEPQRLAQAVERATPSPEQLQGADGPMPARAGAPPSIAERASRFFWEILAPAANGLMLALSLGSFLGVLSFNDLRRGDRILLWGVASLLGFVVVRCVGDLVESVVRSLAQATEPVTNCPKSSAGRMVAGGGLAMIAFLVLAELLAHTWGLQDLHRQKQEVAARFQASAARVEQPPLLVYFLVGSLISLSYLARRAWSAWRDCESQQRLTWAYGRRQAWIAAKRATPPVRRAFELAYEISGLRQTLDRMESEAAQLRRRLESLRPEVNFDPETQARLDQALAAATGETQRFHEQLTQLLEASQRLDKARSRGATLGGETAGEDRQVLSSVSRARVEEVPPSVLADPSGRADGPLPREAAKASLPGPDSVGL